MTTHSTIETLLRVLPAEGRRRPSSTKKQRRIGIAALALILALAGAACGGSDTSSGGFSAEPAPEVEPAATDEVEPAPEPEMEGFELALYVQRENTMLGLSVECYEFYSDGTVELRHGSNNFSEISDVGLVYGDENGGQIDWDSGRSSTYEWNGSEYRVDGALGSVVDSCTS